MKKLLKIGGLLILGLVLALVIAGWISHQPVPTISESGTSADALAQKMETAVNKAAWDTTRFVNWTFRTGTSYQWDKEQHEVIVSWDGFVVRLYTPDQTGSVWENGTMVTDGAAKQAALQKAWSQFANDSFWLCAPMKAFDPGTRRDIVKLEDGSDALLVSYSSGGVTPGDKYLWILDANGLPKAWQMWVNIIPIGGLRFEWIDWSEATGPRIAQDHPSSLFNVPIQALSFPSIEEGKAAFAKYAG